MLQPGKIRCVAGSSNIENHFYTFINSGNVRFRQHRDLFEQTGFFHQNICRQLGKSDVQSAICPELIWRGFTPRSSVPELRDLSRIEQTDSKTSLPVPRQDTLFYVSPGISEH